MNRRQSLTLALALWGSSLKLKAEPAYQDITWDQLVPKGWSPSKSLQLLGQKVMPFGDASPAAQSYLKKLREEWDRAPANVAWNDQAVRIPGFVVPLDVNAQSLQEFLLVPYFGACIHTPPPPANQIIHVSLAEPTALDSMATVWAMGRLKTEHNRYGETVAGYQLRQARVEPYTD